MLMFPTFLRLCCVWEAIDVAIGSTVAWLIACVMSSSAADGTRIEARIVGMKPP
ncbi:hypothetical protein BOTBODRAFT_25690 [Botryobasidium botryosum FD-172 SS1]|uniref:Uncharacterized protein n=1 Tax=Botryobasidium botryosum (strain FD-172 SS1) TaxID=930990 RepID=A0A067NBW3_BOTB1|nr:hypothetical protein BOTBODRAFT_25690 [Botryobasidium botryosum FD-172 SS1]